MHALPFCRDPVRNKRLVPTNGDWHSSGHVAFALNEGFHDCFYGRMKLLLKKDKVPKHIPNFEKDSYKHCTTMMREVLVGTVSYFLLDVTAPPPELLLDDPQAYEALLQDAG